MEKKITIVAALLAGLLVIWIYMEDKQVDVVRPPTGITNLVGFLQAQSQPGKIRKFVHGEKMYVELLGTPNTSLLSLPSGPPAYIFDETGTLVDWCRDLGDQPSFVAKWGGFSNAIIINAEEAKQLVFQKH